KPHGTTDRIEQPRGALLHPRRHQQTPRLDLEPPPVALPPTLARRYARQSRGKAAERLLQLHIPQRLGAFGIECVRLHPVSRPPDAYPDTRLRRFEPTAIG